MRGQSALLPVDEMFGKASVPTLQRSGTLSELRARHRIAYHESPTTYHRSRVTCRQSPVVCCSSLLTRYMSPIARHQRLGTRRLSPATCCWLPRAKSNGCKTGGLERDLLPLDFLPRFRSVFPYWFLFNLEPMKPPQ